MSEWTPEQTAYAVKLWGEGQSASEVARNLKASFNVVRTRNSIIGKVHRLGLSRPARVRRAESTRPKPAKYVARQFSPPKKLPPRPVIMADVSNAKPWTERAFGECAFPIGDRGAVMSCCAPTPGAYCAAHRAAMVSSAPMTTREMKRLERIAA